MDVPLKVTFCVSILINISNATQSAGSYIYFVNIEGKINMPKASHQVLRRHCGVLSVKLSASVGPLSQASAHIHSSQYTFIRQY